MQEVINEQVKSIASTKSQKDEFDTMISRELEKIKHELFDKLARLFDELKNYQMNQKTAALKLQNEISILKKEKLDLYQKITELQKKINDMEITIGQDIQN